MTPQKSIIDESRLEYDQKGDLIKNPKLVKVIVKMLLVSLNLVFMHGLQHKKTNMTHCWQFLIHFASKFKNYRLKTNRQTIARSFSIKMADGLRSNDELSELVALLRMIDLAPSATTEEKFFTWVLHGLKRGSIHKWWDLICSQGISKHNSICNIFLFQMKS